jgi:hemoglobin-like flavoprotein
MTPESRDLVQESWEQAVASHAAAAGELFYDRLLDLDPQLGRLLRSADLREQGRKLVRELGAIVRDLGEEWKAVSPCVEGAYGWENPHDATVGEALLSTLEQLLGDGFTARVRFAWVEAYEARAPEIRRAAIGDPPAPRVVPLSRHRRLMEIES